MLLTVSSATQPQWIYFRHRFPLIQRKRRAHSPCLGTGRVVWGCGWGRGLGESRVKRESGIRGVGVSGSGGGSGSGWGLELEVQGQGASGVDGGGLSQQRQQAHSTQHTLRDRVGWHCFWYVIQRTDKRCIEKLADNKFPLVCPAHTISWRTKQKIYRSSISLKSRRNLQNVRFYFLAHLQSIFALPETPVQCTRQGSHPVCLARAFSLKNIYHRQPTFTLTLTSAWYETVNVSG